MSLFHARFSGQNESETVSRGRGQEWQLGRQVGVAGLVWWVWLSLSLLFHRLDLVANYVKLRGRAGGIFQHRVSFE